VKRAGASLPILLATLGLCLPATAQAAPPAISATSFSAVSETSATLEAKVDPQGSNIKDAHFEYLPLSTYEADGKTFGAGTQKTPKVKIPASPSGPQPLEAQLTGLEPATGYVFRVSAETSTGEIETGPTTTFYTYAEPPLFGPCPNEAFRTGALAPLGHPSALLPDCRAFEQVSPVDKDGNDVVTEKLLSRAASDGSAATFLVSSGLPGGEGAQAIPSYVGSRGESNWSTTGLLPQASAGPRAKVLGWTPDFSETVTQATRQNATTLEGALYVRSDPAAPATQASAYVPMSGNIAYAYAGASSDGQTVVFEVPRALPPEEGEAPIASARPESSNVYAYDTSSGLVSLASVMNSPAETEAALAKGAFAGPYNWGRNELGSGGAAASSYTVDQRAVAADGSVFFTAAGTARLYERLNPTEQQSPLNGQGECTDPTLACTIEVSAGEREPADPAGPQPVAFQAASADGSQVFFTSSEKLTDDANTGPEQPPAQIGRATLGDPDPNATKQESFIPAHALGVAVDPKGEFIYWAEPLKGRIARANLKAPNPKTTVEEYVDTGETENETFDKKGNGSIQKGHSIPRYVALGPCAEGGECVYWTNTGPLGNNTTGNTDGNNPIYGGGTIGRATIGAAGAEDPHPEFIKGASDPQGIVVEQGHLYWTNSTVGSGGNTLARAELGGGGVDMSFVQLGDTVRPIGLAANATHLYFTSESGSGSLVRRVPLAGGGEEFFFVGATSKLRGIAVDSSYVYWAGSGEETIGRIPIADIPSVGSCSGLPTCENQYLTPAGAPFGLAADSAHLYWSVNGESPTNPGNDLYRYSAAADPEDHHLTDLTPDAADPNGAEVIGVLATTPDGSYTYFVANGDLDGAEGPGFAGDCHGAALNVLNGRCDLYLSHDGQITFVAGLRLIGDPNTDDLTDLVPAGVGLVGGNAAVHEKSSFLASDGTLVFRSAEGLPPSGKNGLKQFYRFEPGQGLTCLTCVPTGEPSPPASVEPNLGTPGLAPLNPAAIMPHPFSEKGDRFFFQTTGALAVGDQDGQGGCPTANSKTGFVGICQDVYEWEAPGSGSCEAGGPAYSPLNRGCLYLLSPGPDGEAAFFSDASADGSSAFLFTRNQLVGQDQDNLLDLYSARVEGGLAAQNPLPEVPCEGEEGCRPAATPAPGVGSPQTPGFVGAENPKRPHCPKGKVLRNGRCQKPKRHKRGRRSR
jgi:sugar lactone lactonase YvrE